MVSFGGSSLEVKPRYHLWFLHPSDPSTGPTKDTVIDGDVILNLSSPRKLKTIDVQLIGTQSMRINGAHVSYTTISKTTSIELHETLPAGIHRFEFQLIAEANTTPSERLGEFQHDIPKETRLPHGGVVYAITKHKVVARISGLGMLGSDLVREAGICLQATANKDGYAQSFHQSEALQHPLLGAVHITLLSRFLILYGFLACQIDIPEVAEQINLLDISVVMTQLVTLTNLDKPEQTETAKPFDIPLFKLSESKPDTLPRSLIKGESFHLCENAIRLPSDNTTRQTTSVWSNTGIRLSHKLSVLIRYREHTPSADVKELTVRFNARLSSCDHSLANLSLPDYADSEKGKVYRKAGIPDCLCQLHEFIGEEEVERIYGVGAIQADQVAGRGLSGRAKWEDRQTSERD